MQVTSKIQFYIYRLSHSVPKDKKEELVSYYKANYSPQVRYSLGSIRENNNTTDSHENQSMHSSQLFDEWLEKLQKEEAERKRNPFSHRIKKLLSERKIKPSVFYKNAYIGRKVYSALNCNETYQPTKATAIKCCLALNLNLEDTEEILNSAGFSLSNEIKSDIIIKYCIEKHIYNILEVNLLLYEMNGKILD